MRETYGEFLWELSQAQSGSPNPPANRIGGSGITKPPQGIHLPSNLTSTRRVTKVLYCTTHAKARPNKRSPLGCTPRTSRAQGMRIRSRKNHDQVNGRSGAGGSLRRKLEPDVAMRTPLLRFRMRQRTAPAPTSFSDGTPQFDGLTARGAGRYPDQSVVPERGDPTRQQRGDHQGKEHAAGDLGTGRRRSKADGEDG